MKQTGATLSQQVHAMVFIAGMLMTVTPARAQSVADSVPVWTAQLLTGTTEDRAAALRRLETTDIRTLPEATHQAILAELRRLTTFIYDGNYAIDPADGESAGEYYMALVGAGAAIETDEAYRELLPSVSVSLGVGRRVARLGDWAVPRLVDQMRTRQGIWGLATLGFAWFWADSTGAPLSNESRNLIVTTFMSVAAADSMELYIGLIRGISESGDPAFLPLARTIRDNLDSTQMFERNRRRTLEDDVIPALSAREAASTPASLAAGVARMIDAICYERPAGAERGMCESLRNTFATAQAHLAAGRITPARNSFDTVTRTAERAAADGVLTVLQRGLIVDGIAAIVRKM